ncbi:nitroreductase/quinone reductase family protein [Kitasatospora sp. NPDC056327]|uniref:nitroreductase/quinone reductase family protein n=1 Tax=Kitasatospora sp. NPDC056327 TaxID=3345785 RepID=UPI0035D695E6
MGWNERVIKEFRENNGKVGGVFEGTDLVLLTTAGRRTGRPHTTPVVCLRDSGRHLVFASNGGGPDHPDWYLNLVASPQATVETGTEEGRVKPFAARAVVLEGEERDRLYEAQSALDGAFREYGRRTARIIPVVALHPLDLSVDPDRNRMIGRQLLVHHAELRAELAGIRSAFEGIGPDGGGVDRRPDADPGWQLRRRCLTFCYGLQMHHTREDGAFTAFEQQFPHLVPVIARLREEHRVVESALARLEELLERGEAAEEGGLAGLRAEFGRTIDGLEEHFAREEEYLLPALDVPRPS